MKDDAKRGGDGAKALTLVISDLIHHVAFILSGIAYGRLQSVTINLLCWVSTPEQCF